MALITDGRFSGLARFVIGHITPEAFEGGPIALLEDGDEIEIDAEAQTISVVTDDDTLERRGENWKQPKPYTDQCFSQYARLVSSASLGAVTD